MSALHTQVSSILTILIVGLSTLHHPVSGGSSSLPPGDFTPTCDDMLTYPENQETFVDIDAYDGSLTSAIFFSVKFYMYL